jgi:hypothetical protein
VHAGTGSLGEPLRYIIIERPSKTSSLAGFQYGTTVGEWLEGGGNLFSDTNT